MILTNKPLKTKPPAAKHEFPKQRTAWLVKLAEHTAHYTSLWYSKSDRTMELPFKKHQVLAQKAKRNPIPDLDQAAKLSDNKSTDKAQMKSMFTDQCFSLSVLHSFEVQ